MNQKISETYLIGFDYSENDEAVLTLSKRQGSKLVVVNTIYGDKAVDIMMQLVGGKIK